MLGLREELLLVSVVLPTHRSHPLIKQAVACYLAQDWREKELIVIDSAYCREWFTDVPEDELVYFHAPSFTNLAKKRNIAARIAEGEIIVHFDYDDWQAPTRISHQVEALLKSGKPVLGYHTVTFWDDVEQKASIYRGGIDYGWGPNLCYRREYAVSNPFCEFISVAEDDDWTLGARIRGDLASVDGRGQMVVRLHDGNPRRPTGTENWPYIPSTELPKGFIAA